MPGFGTADDAIVVDLSGLTRIAVDPRAGTARVGRRRHLGMMNDATMAHGLATTGGHRRPAPASAASPSAAASAT